VQWNSLALSEAIVELFLATYNAVYFFDYAARTRSASRQVGAFGLGLLSTGLGLEAALYTVSSLGPGLEVLSGSFAAFFVRSVLLAAATFVSLLIWRGTRR
jgi:hypothetical protein